MKKFVLCAVLLLAMGLGYFYAVYYQGIFIDFQPNSSIDVPFRTEGTAILVQDASGSYTPLNMKGVDISSSMPGQYATSFAPKEEDYLRWLTAIGEMGANTIRVYTIMDADFYNAFYAYNTSHSSPLYLLQGFLVSDQANAGAVDAYNRDFYDQLITDGRNAVDIIHGKKIISTNKMRGTGAYFHDISPWVVGYLVGQEWDSATVAYTDHRTFYSPVYQGTFFSTRDDASSFEAMLAEIMDQIMVYETSKYKTQRLISFINDPMNDLLHYEISYAKQLSKYSYIDAEHILPSDQLLSGYFASYRLFDFCDSFTNYLQEDQKAALAPILSGIDTTGVYGGYLQLLSAYHTMPVVAAGYSFSTARAPVSKAFAPLTEEEQGEALMNVYRQAKAAGWAGVFLSSWQDTWERRTWNTAFSTVLTQNYLWHDLQTDGQNSGIMAYDPGEKERVCVVDGNDQEWEDETELLAWEDLKLYAKTDSEGLYLLIRGKDLREEPLYLPIDTTQESGSTFCSQPKLSFNRAADFLLCLNGTDDTRLLVQERYDPLRENFLTEISGQDPFVEYPEADTDLFVPIGIALQNPTLVNEELVSTAQEAQRLRFLGVWETGKLVHGCGDPDSADYYSLADFCFGRDCVEIRLPWLLLNVGDPSSMQIHSDYYQNFGVLTHSVSCFYLGLGDGSQIISLSPLELKGYSMPTYHERLKKSYSIIQSQWRGEQNAS